MSTIFRQVCTRRSRLLLCLVTRLRRSLVPVHLAVPFRSLFSSPSRSFPFLRFFAPPAAMSCIFHTLLPIATRSSCSQLANIAAGCLLYGTSDTSRVLSPSLRPCINTSQACSILAPLMGFCLQRSVHVPSRTPFGSPCPAFPWPRRRPLGHSPFGWQVFQPLLRLFSLDDGLPALASDRSTARLCRP